MSETVQVALITFLSGLVGAIAGVVGSVIAARTSAKAQIEQTVVQEYFKQRVNAFDAVLAAERELELANWSSEAKEKYSEVVSSACLVASPDASKAILKYHDAIIAHITDMDCLGDLKASAILEMQRDLAVFMKPKIEKNEWD